jgi:hypothetical protein
MTPLSNYRVAIRGSGRQALSLNCEKHALPGNNTQTSCVSPSPFVVKGQVLAQDSLPPFSIEDPNVAGDGCTLTSIFDPKWTFSVFTVEGKASAAAPAAVENPLVGFNIILETPNRRYQYPMPIAQGKRIGDGPWYDCEVGTDGGNGLPLWPYQCSLQYDASKKELTLKADWACSDLDAEQP